MALVFASFLIALGSAIVDDLPQVEQRLQLDDYMDMAQVRPLRAEQERLQQARDAGHS